MLKFPELTGKSVGYIVTTRKQKFKACIGVPHDSPGDNDNFISETFRHAVAHDTAADALAILHAVEPGQLAHIFPAPIQATSMGAWQRELEIFEERAAQGSVAP